MSDKKYQPILGIAAVVLFAGAAWIAYPNLVVLFENQHIKSNLAAVGGTGSATLTWNANTESDLAGYKVYYGTSPRTGTDPKTCGMCGYASSINVGKVTTYSLSGLTNGQTYYFSITAVDTSNNESTFSSEVNKAIPAIITTTTTTTSSTTSTTSSSVTVTTQPSTQQSSDDAMSLLQPSNLSVVTTNLPQVTLSWSPPTSVAVGYYVYRNGYQVANTTLTSYTDTIYPPGAYIYSVSGYDTHGTVSFPSSSITVTLTNPTTPTSSTPSSEVAPSSGLTVDQINAILSLLTSFGADNTTVNNVREVLTGAGTVTKNTSSASSSTSSSSSDLTYNLTLYQTNPEVKVLQQFLNAHGFTVASTGSGSPGNENNYFGVKTYQALIKFQKSVGLPATGWLGPSTRAKISSL